MTLVREVVEDAAIGVGVADTAEGLSALHQPGCAAVIWRRQTPPHVQHWLDTLKPQQLPRGRMILHAEDVRDAVVKTCDLAGLPEGAERNWLIDDAVDLADMFTGLVKARHLRLRFDVVTTNACERFHIDAVTSRLVCTYRGTGTQYGISPDGAEPRRVFTTQTGAPIVLRGTLWPEHPRSGLLHRSPPIEGTGETRLVLVLDPISDPEEES
ncbi:DUF1826 domain-containing protein [Pontivivens ytuae]|uniref:DUF1826 domain-containing protein n=1 Tax=Pontivivens ytuae TaxID=2789856 RepID=A0A7S9LVM1_9RHOB|nr:DUF1826 domain-containing protein [Pontivivens ytuae]QPH55993.1 DUF1826 domain-containing protein [Pontivivens ytuae]